MCSFMLLFIIMEVYHEMPTCSLFEKYQTPSGSTYYICHRPPFNDEGTMLANGELHCQKCAYKK